MGTDSFGRSAPTLGFGRHSPVVGTRGQGLDSPAGATTVEASVAPGQLPGQLPGQRTDELTGLGDWSPPTEDQARHDAAKRVVEFVIAVVGLAVLAPVLVIIALAVAASTRTSPIFVQERIGRDGTTFRCLKFRTMYASANDRLAEVLAVDEQLRAEWEADHKLRRDPRITPLGRVLRKTNLDELPQLANIAAGQMSLVGPRPIVFAEVPKYGSALGSVLTVRPGLTGLWQVSGRNDLPYVERVALDQRYVTERSARGDLAICLATAAQMVDTLLGRADHGAR